MGKTADFGDEPAAGHRSPTAGQEENEKSKLRSLFESLRLIHKRPGNAPQRLVLNADDFGLSPSVNRSILRAAEEGLLKSASLMVTHAAAQDAVLAAAASPVPLALGLHFCLTSGRACAPPEEIPLLADRDGRLKRGFLGLTRLLKSSRFAEARIQARRELAAQWAEFDRLTQMAPNCPVDHLDSHQHIHVLPGLFLPLMADARKRNLILRIPAERIGAVSRLFAGPPVFRARGIAKKMILDHFIRTDGREFSPFVLSETFGAGDFDPDAGYFGILDSGRMNEAAILRILKTLPRLARRGTTDLFEINLHPWRIAGEENVVPETASDADRRFGLSPRREEEWNALCSQRLRETITRLGIEITAFGRAIAESDRD